MKDWKTTITGLIVGAIPAIDALITAYNSGYFTEKTGYQLIIGIGIILFGVFAKDYNVSGGIKTFGDTNPPPPGEDIAGGGQPNPKTKP